MAADSPETPWVDLRDPQAQGARPLGTSDRAGWDCYLLSQRSFGVARPDNVVVVVLGGGSIRTPS